MTTNGFLIENKPEIKKILPLPLEKIFEDEKIKKIFEGNMTEEKLERLENKLDGKFFSLEKEDWEKIMEIIQKHHNYEMEDKHGNCPAAEMENIYFKFPLLLVIFYLKNKTGIDFRIFFENFNSKDEEIKLKENIKNNYSIENIKNFIEGVEKFNNEMTEVKKVIKKKEVIEKINTMLTIIVINIELIEDIFKEELKELNKRIKEIDF